MILDPFCGSGTVLVEAKLLGVNAVGSDINPLAILLAKVKSQGVRPELLENLGRRTDVLLSYRILSSYRILESLRCYILFP
ncbi:hypothetical protein DRN63_04745 [Nanoarchaeota archaeon]|nr:MAG: hypothetical protein DRN63_04745 [Nanoarchaeota archaeon]